MPILIARVLDSSIEPLRTGDASPPADSAGFLVAATAVTAIFSWVNVAYTVRVSLVWWCTCVSGCSVTHSRLSVSFHERYTSGKVISRLTSDIDTVRSFLDSGISQLAITLLSMVNFCGRYCSFWIGVLACLCWSWACHLLLDALVPETAVPVFRTMRTESAHLTSRFVETFTGIRAVKAFWVGGTEAF